MSVCVDLCEPANVSAHTRAMSVFLLFSLRSCTFFCATLMAVPPLSVCCGEDALVEALSAV